MKQRLARLVLVGWMSAATVTAGGAELDFLDQYKVGLAAAERGNWTGVETAMRQAIAGRPKEDARLGAKLYFKRYLPHFYLGRALFEQGDCSAALAAWAESERQGVIQRFAAEKRLMDQGRASCREREAAAAALEKSSQEARQSLGRANSAREALEKRRAELESSGTWASGSPSIGSRFAAATRNLETARRRFDSGERVEIDQAARLADEVATELTALGQEADRLAGEALAARSSGRERLSRAIADGRKTITSLAFLEPFPPEIARRKTEIDEAIRRAETLPATASAEETETLARDLAGATSRLRRAANAPPEALVSSADAYFAGDYGRVVELLTLIDQGDARAKAHALLFRAAARHALYIIGGETDAELLTAAKVDARAAASADRTLSPLASAFPPGFVELFRRETTAPNP